MYPYEFVGVEVLNKQLQSLAKLQPTAEPVILTWTAKQVSETVGKIVASMQKEFKLKQVITGTL